MKYKIGYLIGGAFWGIVFGFSLGEIHGIMDTSVIWEKKIEPVMSYTINESTLIKHTNMVTDSCAYLAEQIKTQNAYIESIQKEKNNVNKT